MQADDKHRIKGRSGVSRRRFVLGAVASGLMTPLAGGFRRAWAAPNVAADGSWLQGPEFDLRIDPATVNLTGKPAPATLINQSLPAPVLHWREGDTVTLRVSNNLPVTSSIHWHGMILPSHMDGVPDISFDGIESGGSFTYRFPVQQSGTYWYHSHSGFQEQTGMYGAIVIDPLAPEPFSYDRDFVIMLSDWSDEPPASIYATLKKRSDYYNVNERTVGDLWRQLQNKGLKQTWQEREMWNRMRMSDRDLSDVSGYSYTFLMNGQPPANGWSGLFKPGERLRLRFINGAAMTFFDVRIPGLKMTVVAADGQYIQPVAVDEFRIGVAETFDVIVQPAADQAYTVFAQAIDRSGFARGTLTPDPRLSAEIPPMDSVPVLSHGDMGMSHAGMTMPEQSNAGHSSSEHAMPTMDHAMPAAKPAMPTMDHAMPAAKPSMPTMDHAMPAAKQYSAHPAVTPAKPHNMAIFHGEEQSTIAHKPSEYGPHVDMRASNPQYRLTDPGVGLRNNGRRVLAYSDLKNRYPSVDQRPPSREIELHLTGNMRRYMWSIDGIKFADAEPIHLNHNERVRFILVNDTMMNHPMHLHGMWSELETGDPDYLPRKHTVVVQPGAKISFLVTADALEAWAFHCHLLYHMPGMFRKVIVS